MSERRGFSFSLFSTDDSDSMASRRSKSKSTRSSHGSKSGSSARSEMERSLVRAAQRKVELQCRAEALSIEHDIKMEESELQRKALVLENRKERLGLETELKIEEANTSVLERLEDVSQRESLRGESGPMSQVDKHDVVQKWLQTSSCGEECDVGLLVHEMGATRKKAPWPKENRDEQSSHITGALHRKEPCLQVDPRDHQQTSHEIGATSGPVHDQESQVRQSVDRDPWEEPQNSVQRKSPHEIGAASGPAHGQGNNNQSVHRNRWEEPQDRTTTGTLEVMKNLAEIILKQQEISTLPKRDINKYGGDPLEYCAFMQAFKHSVDTKSDDNRTKLFYLEQLTVGEANKVVKGFLNRGCTGYEDAMKALSSRFGDKFIVAEAFRRKAESWPEVKRNDAKGWTSFSIFLSEYLNTMRDLNYSHEVEHSTVVKLLMQKLPYGIQDRWRVRADHIYQHENKMAGFEEFSKFVDNQARIQNNPLYGNIGSTDNTNSKNNQSAYKKRTSFGAKTEEKGPTTAANNKGKWCYFCERDSHTLSVCNALKRKPHQERIAFMKEKGLCYGCCKKATHLCKECKTKLTCTVCQKRHPTVLHQERSSYNSSNKEDKQDSSGTGAGIAANHVNSGLAGAGNSSTQSVLPVIVRNRETGVCVKTVAMLDEGSDAVFCTEKLRKQLGASGSKTKLHVQTITGGRYVESLKIPQVMEIMDVNCENIIKLPNVYTCPSVPANTSMPTLEDIKAWLYLSQIDLPECDVKEVHILIGNNVPQALEPWEIVHSESGGPYACKTLLGWTVHGLVKPSNNSSQVESYRVMAWEIEQQLVTMYNQDFSERIIDDTPQPSLEDQQFMDIVSKSARLVNGQYEIALPLKDRSKKLPDNRMQAVQRAEHLKRKFRRNPQFAEEYNGFMDEVLSNKYAEKVPTEELGNNEGKRWYIPHHGVYHPQKNKIRVVYDCASSYRGESLNRELLQGPDLTNTLVGVLLRFRHEPVALMADIKGMFHQVKVPKADRDLQRFLWWPEGNLSAPLTEYRMLTHIFGATSSPSCANYALRQTLQNNQFTDQVKNFYVDDYLQSVSEEKEGVRLARDLRLACSKGGFTLTKWISNSRRVLDTIPKEDRAKEVKNLDLEQDSLPVERALGVQWHVELDSFGFKIQIKDRPLTRRGILSVASSIYDPLGFASAAVLPAKILLQNLTRLNISWDEEIPDDYKKRWNQWLLDLPKLASLSLPRCYKSEGFEKPTTVELHHFSDASQVGYGTVSYLCLENNNGDRHCAFVTSKARVAPMKQVTVPRLELTAATVAVRVDKLIQKELDMPINNTYYWTDSTAVLRYIHNESTRFHTFVANRLQVIREASSPSQWRYIDTARNPADDCSRGMSVEKFIANARWFKGPEFLKEPQSEWPVQPQFNDRELLCTDPEVKAVVNAVHVQDHDDPIERLLQHYSKWHQLKKAVAYLLRLKGMLLHKVKERHKITTATNKNEDSQHISATDYSQNSLTVKDLQNAEEAIIRYVQQKEFAKEIDALQASTDQTTRKKCVNRSSSLYRLDPQLKDGILRVGGRLRRSALPEETKYPVILPKESMVTVLILRYLHESSGHGGRSHVIALSRKRYWIIKVNSATRKIIHKCILCTKQRGRVFEQKMADLPADRVLPDNPPFTSVGMDFFGPLEVKRGRSMVKRYGVVFTCLAIRAVHIEKADSLTTDACISAIRRFVARRGQVKLIRSDNGTNIVGAQRELRREIERWNQDVICDALLQRDIEWQFNPPAASHFGGVWERQIRTIRKIMLSITKEQTLTDESMSTLFCEVEAIINGRPITRVSEDTNDLEAITPNHLLLLKGKPNMPPTMTDPKDQYVSRRWRQVQYLADIFWRRWTSEYLPQLQERQKWNENKTNVKPGDVVLLVDNTAPRNCWQMGRILMTRPDEKGQVRSVQVKTSRGVYIRPICKLILLLEGENPEVSTATPPATQQPVTALDTQRPGTHKVQQQVNNSATVKDGSVKTRCGRLVKPKKRFDL